LKTVSAVVGITSRTVPYNRKDQFKNTIGGGNYLFADVCLHEGELISLLLSRQVERRAASPKEGTVECERNAYCVAWLLVLVFFRRVNLYHNQLAYGNDCLNFIIDMLCLV
jgi:hypothetical protein